MSKYDKALEIISQKQGIIRTSDAIRSGIHPRVLYELRDSGRIEMISRGVYRLSELDALSSPDISIIAARVPGAVLCLVSALSFHNLTTQIPYKVSIAIEREAKIPRIDYPPVSVHRFSGKSFTSGIETHITDGVNIRIYDAEKTLADCFKFRNKIGMEVVLESLKFYRSRHRFDIEKLLEYARICRVKKIMKPYLEAVL